MRIHLRSIYFPVLFSMKQIIEKYESLRMVKEKKAENICLKEGVVKNNL